MWEVVTTELPWANKLPLEILCAVLGGKRPDFPLGTPAFIADVARRCWAEKVDERPTFRAVMEDLKYCGRSQRLSAPSPKFYL